MNLFIHLERLINLAKFINTTKIHEKDMTIF